MAEQKVLMVKLTSAKPDEKQSIKTRLRELITELQEVSAAMKNGSATASAPPSKPASSQTSATTHTNGVGESKKQQLDNDLDMMAAEPQESKDTGSDGVNPELQAKLKKLREERQHEVGQPATDTRCQGIARQTDAKESAVAWFASFPECESVEVNESTGELEVKYKTRFAADQARVTIPALGTLHFAWPTISASTNGSSTSVPIKKSPTIEPVPLHQDVDVKANSTMDEDGWGASGGWDEDDEDGGRRDRM
ncbi:hypothetical protein RHS01_00981 [Rhizoctonia solani]|uniref:Uncharacterized protein n=1 Tax=Rhizoctonia solani TaxID=456999 RepID=A0A8H7INU9_9AGAM|nr:hypothetical protein RHS01_00981 [Rhizoctonia solani]